MKKIRLPLILAAAFLTGLYAEFVRSEERAVFAVKEFTVVTIQYEGTKIWVPGTLIVNKGDKVKIHLVNNIPTDPNTHGYAIDEFGVKEVVERKKPKTVEFTADKDGIFRIYCHQHPGHVGGQLLVLK